MEKIRYNKDNPLTVIELFAGYGSQRMALERLKRDNPDFDYKVVAISEIDNHALAAYEAVHGDCPNLGDVSKISWADYPQFKGVGLVTYSFPCFVAGTWVRTSNGLKKIEDISADELVLTHTNSYKRVVKSMKRDYQGVTYSIECPLFQSLVCTEKHPLYVRAKTKGHTSNRKFGNPQWLSPRDMMADLTKEPIHGIAQTRGYHIGYAINQSNQLPQWDGVIATRWKNNVNKLSALFENVEFWYVMGRYVGDGWKRTNDKYGNSVIICCSERNKYSLLSSLDKLPFHYNVIKDRTVDKVYISCNELVAFLNRYGYYAHGKHIDAETINLPAHLLKGFLDGMMDSDGCKNGDWCHITSVSEELVYDLGQCVAKVYHRPFSIYKTKRPKTTVIEGRTVNQRDSWMVKWKITDDKQDRAFYEDGYIWAPIMKMTWQQSRCTVYNMEVDEDNSYTANGAIVHNCQDISNAGKQKGFEKGSGTRSGLLWECEKCFRELRPKYLLLENVKALVQKKFMPHFQEWLNVLDELGYNTYWQILDASKYGVPQHRERVFAVSILRTESDPNPHYNFPAPFPLEKRLKDVLEEEVDESYYLSDCQVQRIIEHCDRKVAEGCGFRPAFTPPQGVSNTITSRYGGRETDPRVKLSTDNPIQD